MANRLATAAEVVALVPELAPLLADVPDTFAAWLDAASLVVGARFARRRSQAHALLTAHMLASTQDVATPGGGGAIASEALGPASVSYSTGSGPTDAELGSTRYGQAYLQLRAVVRGMGSGLVANCRIRQS
jgi:hypothetical protein